MTTDRGDEPASAGSVAGGPAAERAVSRETGAAPPCPDDAAAALGPVVVAGLEQYAARLADGGVVRGLIGPREVPRLWERHLLNCAAVADVIAPGSTVADVGTGAGLPGLVLALVRPDLRVVLVDPLLRRTTFLTEVVDQLDLGGRVEVVRSRAEDLHGLRSFDVVTSRAVAPVERLLRWCAPLVEAGGEVVAMKGSSVQEELDAARPALGPLGCGAAHVDEVVPIVGPPVRLLRVHPEAAPAVSSSVGSRNPRRSSAVTGKGRRRRP